jgi:hypothetical protein
MISHNWLVDEVSSGKATPRLQVVSVPSPKHHEGRLQSESNGAGSNHSKRSKNTRGWSLFSISTFPGAAERCGGSGVKDETCWRLINRR